MFTFLLYMNLEVGFENRNQSFGKYLAVKLETFYFSVKQNYEHAELFRLIFFTTTSQTGRELNAVFPSLWSILTA